MLSLCRIRHWARYEPFINLRALRCDFITLSHFYSVLSGVCIQLNVLCRFPMSSRQAVISPASALLFKPTPKFNRFFPFLHLLYSLGLQLNALSNSAERSCLNILHHPSQIKCMSFKYYRKTNHDICLSIPMVFEVNGSICCHPSSIKNGNENRHIMSVSHICCWNWITFVFTAYNITFILMYPTAIPSPLQLSYINI